jgi:HSP20 family protein
VVETEQFYYVMLELPGILLQDINIEIVEDGGSSLSTLTVSCDRKVQPFVDSSASYLQKETSNGRLQRTFALPKDAAATQASAQLNLAVLTITIPRTAQVVSQGRRIIAISSEPLQQQQGQQQPQQHGSQQQRSSQGQGPSDGTPSVQRSKK